MTFGCSGPLGSLSLVLRTGGRVLSAPNTYWGSPSSKRPWRIDSLGVSFWIPRPRNTSVPWLVHSKRTGSLIRPVICGLETGAEIAERPTLSASRECCPAWEGEWATNQNMRRRTCVHEAIAGSNPRTPVLLAASPSGSVNPSSRNATPVMRRVRPLSLH